MQLASGKKQKKNIYKSTKNKKRKKTPMSSVPILLYLLLPILLYLLLYYYYITTTYRHPSHLSKQRASKQRASFGAAWGLILLICFSKLTDIPHTCPNEALWESNYSLSTGPIPLYYCYPYYHIYYCITTILLLYYYYIPTSLTLRLNRELPCYIVAHSSLRPRTHVV
jgi:hypothetical protein